MGYEIYTLTEEQKAIALQFWDKEDLGTIARRCFGEHSKEGLYIDGRSTEAKSVKAFLAGEGKRTKVIDTPLPTLTLTDEQKQIIEDLAPRVKGSLELARTVFNDQTIMQLSKPHRVVMTYAKEIYPEGFSAAEEPVDEARWKPPITLSHLVGLVNTYVLRSDNRKTYNPSTLKPSEEKALRALMVNLRNYRLGYIASEYKRKVDRELFLSTFIRWTHTKPDLTEIEVDTMISAAAETVTVAQLEREIQEIKDYHEQIMRGEIVTSDGKTKRYGDAEVEQINGVRTKHTAAKKELRSLMLSLETERAKRMKERNDRAPSVLALLDVWMKDKERRDEWIKEGVKEKQEDAKEVERISGIEDLIALVSGQSKEEARE